jgi:hypothetical protein
MTRAVFLAIALLISQGVLAQEFGRLFFTPEQRVALDARRKARVPDKPSAPVVASPTTRLDGYVKRSGGKTTVWVNGEPMPESAPEAPPIVQSPRGDAQVAVPLGEGSARTPLKPGQTVDRGSGEVRDVIGGGQIRIERKAP